MKSLSLAEIPDYNKAEDVLLGSLVEIGSSNEVYEQLGHISLVESFRRVSPLAFDAVRSLHDSIDTEGLAVLHDTGVNKQPDQLAQLTATCLSSIFGKPTRTDKQNLQIAWPVRFNPALTVTPTISQSLGEAAFHTDTQYYLNPEKYFGLFCIVSDLPGKGTNLFIRGEDAVRAFSREYGVRAAAELTKPFPFRVPSAFTETVSDEDVEINWAPIYDPVSGRIRYRKDTAEKALEQPGVNISDSQRGALENFDSLLGQLDPICYHLEPGDAALVNNHVMLHARTDFDNPNRFLYRVRMDDVR